MKKFTVIASTIAATTATAIVVPPIVVASVVGTQSLAEKIFKDALGELEQMCKIPRTSNPDNSVCERPENDRLDGIRNHLRSRVESFLGAGSVNEDQRGSIWWDINPSSGCENYKNIILQGHMDMVWDAQNEALMWDPLTHPAADIVEDIVDGEKVLHSKDYLTSLGIDDGEGLSLLIALTKYRNQFHHGKIRCLVTVDEETTQEGAKYLGCSLINGKITNTQHVLDDYDYLINVDGDVNNQITVSSGGSRLFGFKAWEIPVEKFDTTVNYAIRLSLENCLGGHSAVTMTEAPTPHVNPIYTLFTWLSDSIILSDYKIKLFDIRQGEETPVNVIPRNAQICFTLQHEDDSPLTEEDEAKIRSQIDIKFNVLKKDNPNEKEMSYKLETDFLGKNIETYRIADCTPPGGATINVSEEIIKFVARLPYGQQSFYDDGFVKSSANVCPITLITNSQSAEFNLQSLIRYNELNPAGVTVEKAFLKQVSDIENILVKDSTGINASVSTGNRMAPWEDTADNPLRDVAINAYKDCDQEPVIGRVHGGLECSNFCERKPTLKQINIGPRVEAEHNVKETLHVDTYLTLSQVLINILEHMNFE